ncbi:MAG: hypothetical protein ABI468_01525 [Candidatus Nanopelagicales bacterium]
MTDLTPDLAPVTTPAEGPPLLRLRAGLAALRRDQRTWQIGIDPSTAVLVRHADEAVARGLRALDRWHHPEADPADVGLLPPELLTALERCGLLAPDASPRGDRSAMWHGRHFADAAAGGLAGITAAFAERRRRRVAVEGSGPVAALVATGLAAAGIGTVAATGSRRPVRTTDLTPAGPWERDLGRPWADATADAVRALHAGTTLVEDGTPDLVVLTQAADADAPWCDPEHGDRWLRAAVAHLAVTVAGRGAQIGQVVIPGRTACLNCRELAHAHLEPAWPVLASGLRRLARDGAADTPMALSRSLVGAAAALGVSRALAHLDGCEDGADAYDLLLRLPGAEPQRQSAAPQDACGCRWMEASGTMQV